MCTVEAGAVVEVGRPLDPAVPETADPLVGGLVDAGDIDQGRATAYFVDRCGIAGQVVAPDIKVIPEAAALCDIYCPPRDAKKARCNGGL